MNHIGDFAGMPAAAETVAHVAGDAGRLPAFRQSTPQPGLGHAVAHQEQPVARFEPAVGLGDERRFHFHGSGGQRRGVMTAHVDRRRGVVGKDVRRTVVEDPGQRERGKGAAGIAVLLHRPHDPCKGLPQGKTKPQQFQETAGAHLGGNACADSGADAVAADHACRRHGAIASEDVATAARSASAPIPTRHAHIRTPCERPALP